MKKLILLSILLIIGCEETFRHHYGIRRVHETNGNIFQVAMEMGHKNTNTTMNYLRFQPDEIKQYFPSLIPIIDNVTNSDKNSISATKGRGTIYDNVNKLSPPTSNL